MSPLTPRFVMRSQALSALGRSVFALAGGLVFASLLAASEPALEPIAPIQAPFPMPQLTRPVFPARDFNLRDFGAVEGGAVKNTEAFAKAVAACAAAGGGRVVVPSGRWLTGPIHLRSHVNLHLDEGAVVVFSDRFEDYLPPVLVRTGGVELYNYSPLIYARDCVDVAITGTGRLDGNGDAWWAWKHSETKDIVELAPKGVPVEKRVFGTPKAGIRPNFVVLFNCRNVLLEGFTIGSGPCWTLHPVYCDNLIIRRVTVDTHGPNNDGIDPDSCRNVLIEHCRFRTGDDCVVLKSGYNEDGWRVGRPTENVVMRDCYAAEGHGGLVIGSEMSGGVRNVYVHDCVFEGTDRAVRIKSMRGRGGVVENVWADNLVARNLKREAVIINMDYGSDPNRATNARPPVFRNFHISRLRCEDVPVAMRITGLADSPVQNVEISDTQIKSRKGVIVGHASGLAFVGVKLELSHSPAYDLQSVNDVVIRRSPANAKALLKLAESGAGAVSIEDCDLAANARGIEYGEGASQASVNVR